jgi:nitrogen fixation/metabolism regulation signal transduction histidine kinase
VNWTLRRSLEGKVAAVAGACVLVAVALGAVLSSLLGSAWLGGLFALALALPLALWSVHRLMKPANAVLRGLVDGVASLKDGDFSMSLARDRNDELGELVQAYNGIGAALRAERQHLMQRELLLDTVIQTSPLALVLTGPTGAIVYSNSASRQLFLGGRRLEGLDFDALVATTPRPLAAAVAAGGDGLFTVETDTGRETWHLSQKAFLLNARAHRLYLFKHLTRELNRAEVDTWKRVIRVIGHELNNTLAPLSSLAHSGRQLAERRETERLVEVFVTIADRAQHLKAFIEGYARFAKLPTPLPETVHWPEFVARLANVTPFRLAAPLPEEPGRFDPGQVEQALINLLKNAAESGSAPDEVALSVQSLPGGTLVRVLDRGSGMSEAVLSNALLPFYSTKRSGTGLGLALCREVVEAHGGRIHLANRPGGGLEVSLWLPA